MLSLSAPLSALKGKSLAPFGFAPLAAIMFTPLYAPVFASGPLSNAHILNPVEIDRAVASFTGAQIGEVGGARTKADSRLRLSACAIPLSTSWHGVRRAAVKVECQDTIDKSAPWYIFVSTQPALGSSQSPSVSQANLAPNPVMVKRGDPVTVLVRGRGFSVQQSGEALENGRIGDWIAVRTNRRSEPVRAKIERPGLAIIPVG